MLRNFLFIIAACFFLAGPIAKINELPNSEYYLGLSVIGLLLITFLAIKKSKTD
jgi:hypothetical protein